MTTERNYRNCPLKKRPIPNMSDESEDVKPAKSPRLEAVLGEPIQNEPVNLCTKYNRENEEKPFVTLPQHRGDLIPYKHQEFKDTPILHDQNTRLNADNGYAHGHHQFSLNYPKIMTANVASHQEFAPFIQHPHRGYSTSPPSDLGDERSNDNYDSNISMAAVVKAEIHHYNPYEYASFYRGALRNSSRYSPDLNSVGSPRRSISRSSSDTHNDESFLPYQSNLHVPHIHQHLMQPVSVHQERSSHPAVGSSRFSTTPPSHNNCTDEVYLPYQTNQRVPHIHQVIERHQELNPESSSRQSVSRSSTDTHTEELAFRSYQSNIRAPQVPHTSHHRDGPSDQRYQCLDCGKSYSTFAGLNKHREFHCPAIDGNQARKTFKCEKCGKINKTISALKMHIRTHTLPNKCHICEKAFSRPWLLQGHIRTHTGEKPFACQHCQRAFADRSNLRAHLQTHTDVKKYSCASCDKTFSRMSLLSKHIEQTCAGAPQPKRLIYS